MMLIISEVTCREKFSICVGVRSTKAKGYISKSEGFSYHAFSVLLGLKRRSVLGIVWVQSLRINDGMPSALSHSPVQLRSHEAG
jgi:hypothetical protein